MLIISTICVPDRSVWVSDSQQPFVDHPGMSPDVLYLKEKQPLVIPCRVTHPNVTTTLVKVSACDLILVEYTHTHIRLCPITTLTFSAHQHLSHFLSHRGSHMHRLQRPLSSSFTLFLSWQPLLCGVCVRLFVSVCGYVWKCVRICLWVLVLECWVRRCVDNVAPSAKGSVKSACCLRVCLFLLCVCVNVIHVCLLKSARNPFQSKMPLSLLRFFSDGAAPSASCWRCFYLWRQDMRSGVPIWPPASTTSHISPSTSCSRNPGCQLPLTDT